MNHQDWPEIMSHVVTSCETENVLNSHLFQHWKGREGRIE